VEAVAARVAELLAARDKAPERWIGVAQAAEHLACGTNRVYALVSAGRIPFVKEGSRVLFRRSTLDAWLTGGGGIRPYPLPIHCPRPKRPRTASDSHPTTHRSEGVSAVGMSKGPPTGIWPIGGRLTCDPHALGVILG